MHGRGSKIAGKEGQIKIHAINDIKAAKFEYGTIDVYDMNLVNMDRHIFGKVSKMCGEAAFQYVVKVIELAQSGEIDATVTNALNKEAIIWQDIIIRDIQRFMQSTPIQTSTQ